MNMRHHLEFYGIESHDEVNTKKAREIRNKVDMLRFFSKGDPPLYLHNPKPDKDPTSSGAVIHHPRHAFYVEKIAKKYGIKTVRVTHDVPKEERVDLLDFFFNVFGVKAK